MTKYQIKLAKLYAELIGIDALVHRGGLLYPNDQGYMFENGVTCDWFNPFKGQLQLDARDDFKVEVSHEYESVEIMTGKETSTHGDCWVGFSSKSEIPQAVLECILKSKGKL